MTLARKYRKKPVVIEAMLFDGTTQCADELRKWGNGAIDDYWGPVPPPNTPGLSVGIAPLIIRITTLAGVMEARGGDYIIKGVAGEFYPCKPDIFAATYDEVEARETF